MIGRTRPPTKRRFHADKNVIGRACWLKIWKKHVKVFFSLSLHLYFKSAVPGMEICAYRHTTLGRPKSPQSGTADGFNAELPCEVSLLKGDHLAEAQTRVPVKTGAPTRFRPRRDGPDGSESGNRFWQRRRRLR